MCYTREVTGSKIHTLTGNMELNTKLTQHPQNTQQTHTTITEKSRKWVKKQNWRITGYFFFFDLLLACGSSMGASCTAASAPVIVRRNDAAIPPSPAKDSFICSCSSGDNSGCSFGITIIIRADTPISKTIGFERRLSTLKSSCFSKYTDFSDGAKRKGYFSFGPLRCCASIM